MNWKILFIGVGTGMAAGMALSKVLDHNKSVSSEKALENAKAAFKKHGPIQGSWIQMEKQPYKKALLEYDVYIGGITRKADDKTEQFEFIADSKTGAILDAYLLK